METTKAASTRRAAMSENTAPKMQRVNRMKSMIVGLLAVVALTGCGVGMDDPEGQEALSGSTAAPIMAASGDNAAGGQAELRGPVGQDPRTALPQDPIPVYEGRSVPPSTPRPGK